MKDKNFILAFVGLTIIACEQPVAGMLLICTGFLCSSIESIKPSKNEFNLHGKIHVNPTTENDSRTNH